MICSGAGKIDTHSVSSAFKRFDAKLDNWNKLYDDFTAVGILGEKLSNFGRISKPSKQAIFSVAMALYDAGIALEAQERNDIAVIAGNKDCCLHANYAYFKDYVKHGRAIGRGNLFVNTLPTTPGAVAGIACGLHGMLYFFASSPTKLISPALKEAEFLLESGAAAKVVLVMDDDANAAAFVLEPGNEQAAWDVSHGIADFFNSICNTHKHRI